MKSDSALEDSTLVVAHPDDEVLWFASVLGEIDRIIIIFRDFEAAPDLGAKRSRAIHELPFNVSCLAIPEAGSYGLADWQQPKTTSFGLELTHSPGARDAVRSYEANFPVIQSNLRSELAGRRNVFTHNPWGDYGHEDHVQIFRAVETLQRELGFDLWVSGYCSSRSQTFAESYGRPAPARIIRRPVDRKFATGISAIYRKHGCWTWAEDHEWPPEERFIQAPILQGAEYTVRNDLTFVAAPGTS